MTDTNGDLSMTNDSFKNDSMKNDSTLKTVFELSKKGKSGVRLPSWELEPADALDDSLVALEVDLPEISEPEAVRHYTKLSTLNFGVDTGMYPLGSCTMKYNPKINEQTASLAGFQQLHPMCSDSFNEGSIQLMGELGLQLCQITGFSGCSLLPAAGAHGELAASMIIRKYYEKQKVNPSQANGFVRRDTVLIPDSAHGTNPASVSMCGFKIKEVPSNSNGDVNIDALKELLDGSVAALMLTSPSTLGLFDRNILEISALLKDNGSLFYCDGANLNAVMGRAAIADMGFDLMHINLHKTFSTPHGGGGPGSGPICVTQELEPFLPIPVTVCKKNKWVLEYQRPDTIGRIHSFYGNFLVLVRAYTYILMLGGSGIREVSDHSVLSANYLKEKLRKYYNLPIDRVCMHEFVLNDKNMPDGITTNEIAKRILDYGFHAPTIYFPLLISGSIMIEPTETESKESLDQFVEALIAIRKEADNQPELLHDAPLTTPVRRVDSVQAARKPRLHWDCCS